MAAFSSLHFISLSLLFLCASSENNASVVSPNDICPKTRNPGLCLRVLGSTSGNLTDLGGKAAESAKTSVYYAMDEAQALGKFQSDSVLRGKYCSCYKSFGRAKKAIAQYSKTLGLSPDFFLTGSSLIGGKLGWCDLREPILVGLDPSLPVAASDALKAAGVCDPIFSQQPSSEPTNLKIVSNNLQDVCSVLLVTAQQFAA